MPAKKAKAKAAPYRDKKITLEMSDRERKVRQLGLGVPDPIKEGPDVKTPTRGESLLRGAADAASKTLAALGPAGRILRAAKGAKAGAAASKAKEADKTQRMVREAARTTDIDTRPEVNNKLVADFLKGAGKGTYGVRNVFSDAELESIKKTGYMLPSPKEIKSGTNRKWFTHTDSPDKQTLRVKAENIPPNRAVRRQDVEFYNKETGKYEPLNKGGMVKKRK